MYLTVWYLSLRNTQISPNLFNPWLKCPLASPATRTCDRARQCSFGVPTALIHRSINDSASSTATHLCSSNNRPLVDKLRIDRTRRLHKNLLRPLLTPAILRVNFVTRTCMREPKSNWPSIAVSSSGHASINFVLFFRHICPPPPFFPIPYPFRRQLRRLHIYSLLEQKKCASQKSLRRHQGNAPGGTRSCSTRGRSRLRRGE